MINKNTPSSRKSSAINKSIAVLPFVNMSADPDNEYFSDGITEEILNVLTRIKGLKVIARTSSFSFKGKNIDIRTIGTQLGVSTILEGSVRKVKNRVRITAQLINTTDGMHIWSKNYDRQLEDIFTLQDEISELIADQIRENFGHLDIPPLIHPTTPTQILEAYDLVLKGNYFLKRKDFEDIKKALKLFQAAIQLDPNYAVAYAALGETYLHAAGFGILPTSEAHNAARNASEKAIALNSDNAQGYKVLAYVKLFHDWDWEGALMAYDNAIQRGLPDQNEFISYYYVFIEEDFEKAIQVAKRGIETDPLHVITHWQLGLIYYFARQFEAAIKAFNGALSLYPNFGEALRFRGLCYGYLGKYTEALTDINDALASTGGQGLANLDLLMVKILMGKKEEVITVIKQSEYIDASDPAALYSMLNMPDDAIDWLEKAYVERSVMMVSLKNFWVWDNLRTDVRFQAIYQRMKFPPSIEHKKVLNPITAKSVKSSTILLSKQEVAYYLQQLELLHTKEQIFTDPALSLRQVANKIELHPNKLSWLLNEHINKNFNEYINSFRLELFKQKALDPANSHLTLLGIAYESGFNSKTVFNAFFKKMMGMTPRTWVKTKR